jgi:hypothetical protein
MFRWKEVEGVLSSVSVLRTSTCDCQCAANIQPETDTPDVKQSATYLYFVDLLNSEALWDVMCNWVLQPFEMSGETLTTKAL